jgi:hypothetical protein
LAEKMGEFHVQAARKRVKFNYAATEGRGEQLDAELARRGSESHRNHLFFDKRIDIYAFPCYNILSNEKSRSKSCTIATIWTIHTLSAVISTC